MQLATITIQLSIHTSSRDHNVTIQWPTSWFLRILVRFKSHGCAGYVLDQIWTFDVWFLMFVGVGCLIFGPGRRIIFHGIFTTRTPNWESRCSQTTDRSMFGMIPCLWLHMYLNLLWGLSYTYKIWYESKILCKLNLLGLFWSSVLRHFECSCLAPYNFTRISVNAFFARYNKSSSKN